MRELTGGSAKELLPIHGAPVLYHVLRECEASGAHDVLVVVSPEKHDEIDDAVAGLAATAGFPATISLALQAEPHGLADAIRVGRDFAGDQPLAVALPDNLFVGGSPGVAQVADTFGRTGLNVVAVVEIFATEAGVLGPTGVYPGHLTGDEFHMLRIPSKGARAATFNTAGASSAFTGVGRYIFLPEVFGVIDEVEQTLRQSEELDDIPVLQRLLQAKRLIGRRMKGRFLDVGIPEGYAEANSGP